MYDIETHNTDKGRPYCICSLRLENLAGRYNYDLSQYELEKRKNDTLCF